MPGIMERDLLVPGASPSSGGADGGSPHGGQVQGLDKQNRNAVPWSFHELKALPRFESNLILNWVFPKLMVPPNHPF